MLALTNGKIIREDKVVEGQAILVEDGKIHSLIDEDHLTDYQCDEVIDCKGAYISPGMVDIHSDYVEQIVSPRPQVLVDMGFALRETERILVTSGITTMYHSLALMAETINKKKARQEENVLRLIEEINHLDASPHIIHNRVHLRYEISSTKYKDKVKDLISQGKVHLLSFMDHTPGQGQYRDLEVYRQTLRSYDSSITEDYLDERIKTLNEAPKLKLEDLKDLADHAKAHGVALASHDDDSIDKLDLAKSLGTRISEFPIDLEVATQARAMGLYTVVGAPNVLVGKSHSGNLSGRQAIEAGQASVIASDYYPSAMLINIFNLVEDLGLALHEAFNMVTINPARAVGIDDELGSIDPGKNADLLVIDKKGAYPIIKTVLIDGQEVYEARYRYDS